MSKCYLCNSKERDEIKYGEFMTRGKVSVHYYCLLLTSNLMQKGSDDQGFLGFLISDIKDEANRVASAVCCYCKSKSANISCCATKCYKTFHLTCGIKNGAENQFMGTFKSYCNRHISGKKVRRPNQHETCCICYESIYDKNNRFSSVNQLRAPCCKNGWFHKWCLAAFAKTAGYFFKCPLCNDNKVFRQRLAQKGIFIPDRDAAWELVPNAFAELLERPNECSAVVCEAKGGRSAINGQNKLQFCGTCGSVAIHRKCMKSQGTNFTCDECSSIISGVKNASIVNISASQQSNSDEEEDVDICDEDESSSPQNNFQCQVSESGTDDEFFVQRGRANVRRIFDNETPSSVGKLYCDDDIVRRKVNRKPSRALSSDGEGSTPLALCAQLNNNNSCGGDDDDDESVQIKVNKKRNILFSSDEEESIPSINCVQRNSNISHNDSDIVKRKFNKKSNRILSSDDEGSIVSPWIQKKIKISHGREILFDSGGESDRSASSGEKLSDNLENEPLQNDVNKFNAICPLQVTTSFSSQEKVKVDTCPVIKQRSSENLVSPDIARGTRRFISLNETPNENWCIAKRTRRQSTCAEELLNRYIIKDEVEEEVARCRLSSTRRFSATLPSEYKFDKTLKIEDASLSFKNTIPEPTQEVLAKIKTEDSCRSKKKSPALQRTNSEDPSNTTPALERIRRRSFIRSPYSNISKSVLESERSSILPNSAVKKRSRSESNPENDIAIKKRKDFSGDECENNFQNSNSRNKMRQSRGRSPLSSNLCSLYAFITPKFVKKKEFQNEDKPGRSGEVLLPTTETIEFSNNSKSNIAKSSNVKTETAAIKQEDINTSPILKYFKSPQERYPNSWSILIDTPSKSKPSKPRNKCILKSLPNPNVPSNQTKIESFFKRI